MKTHLQQHRIENAQNIHWYLRPGTWWLCIWVLIAGGLALGAFSGRAASNIPARRDNISSKPIEQVKAGDQVLSFDVQNSQWIPQVVRQPMVRDYEGELVSLRISGETLEATANHPFWVVNGKDLAGRPVSEHVPAQERVAAEHGRWVDAGNLLPGDELVVRSGQRATVEEIHSRRVSQKVYNLEVENLHTYAVGETGVAVHNCNEGGNDVYIYRGATKGNPNHVTARVAKGETGISFRDGLHNPSDPSLAVLRPGANYIKVDAGKLPPGSVVFDGGKVVDGVLMPEGHVSVYATPQQILDATVEGGKFPK